MKKRAFALILTVALCLGLPVIPASAAGISRTKSYTPGMFTDVPAGAWYANSVKDAYELGLMSGTGADTFNPTGMFTLAEAATIAARMHSLWNGGSGAIAPAGWGAWYQGAVDYCVENGIFALDDFFDFSRNATRAEMAGIMAAALPDTAWEAIHRVYLLPDVYQAYKGSTPYAEEIYKLYKAGVFTGSDEYGLFQPYASITRAEAAAIVSRCAEPAQRKAVVTTLTLMCNRKPPEIVGTRGGDMSCGRMVFKDGGKCGVLDQYGNVVVPASYDRISEYDNGYALVKLNGKYGIIDINGNQTTPVIYPWYNKIGGIYAFKRETSSNDRALAFNGRIATPFQYRDARLASNSDTYNLASVNRDGKWGIVNAAGVEIVPCQYGETIARGGYAIGSVKSGSNYNNDLYNTAGMKLVSYVSADDTRFVSAKGSRLFAVKEGKKWAVGGPWGLVTEAVYDYVTIAEDSNLAIVTYGKLKGLVGLDGECIAPGVYDRYRICDDGNYAAFQGNGEFGIASRAGVEMRSELVEGSYDMLGDDAIAKEGSYYFVEEHYDVGYLFDGSGKLVSGRAKMKDQDGYLCFCWGDDGEAYFMTDNGKISGPFWGCYADNTYSMRDGKDNRYGIWLPATGVQTDPIYEYTYTAKKAVDRYISDWHETDHIGYTCKVEKNSAGKPCVYYGSYIVGWEPMIEYYNNNYNSNMYYDEIRDIGEGYYACRYNTTWYLAHP